MAPEAVIAFVNVPSHKPGPDANYAYGDWVWIGPQNLAQKVVEHLEGLPDSMLRLALENRAQLWVIDASKFTPAEIRGIKARIVHRLTKGPLVSECVDGEPCIFVPVRNGGKWPVQEPLPSTPFAWYVVQKAVTEAERVWSIVDANSPGSGSEGISPNNQATAVLIQPPGRDDKDKPIEPELPERVKTAREQFETAFEGINKDKVTDREAYDWWVESCKNQGKSFPLPDFATWQRYLRIWRKSTGQQKNTPRSGRADSSKSVVRQKDV